MVYLVNQVLNNAILYIAILVLLEYTSMDMYRVACYSCTYSTGTLCVPNHCVKSKCTGTGTGSMVPTTYEYTVLSSTRVLEQYLVPYEYVHVYMYFNICAQWV